MYYFVSDWHFGHENIIRYCSRPFSNADEMDAKLVELHNDTVGVTDTVFVLGDVFLGNRVKAVQNVQRLQGKKILIRGNHDRRFSDDFFKRKMGFKEVHSSYILTDVPKVVLMRHVPWDSLKWAEVVLGDPAPVSIGGHIHNRTKYIESPTSSSIAINVCVDVTGFKPLSYDEVLKREIEYLSQSFYGETNG